eukprot:CAMPEP_0178798348 /NCGR_PEP_ID=MMETSP0745-20121128/11703_1 /TAXON_ID=913974 /ORGANISM="Nitzschia punctata, Strain CCMP561" /LENGTH=57 /DNA_ID=CAMNT_0020456985 /DNA_START=230 /DNA_END=403 /DNA_ORIENTATION=+
MTDSKRVDKRSHGRFVPTTWSSQTPLTTAYSKPSVLLPTDVDAVSNNGYKYNDYYHF